MATTTGAPTLITAVVFAQQQQQQQQQKQQQQHDLHALNPHDPVAFLLASVCAGLAIAISAHSISVHLRHFNAPRYQLYICRILLMVPVYASVAWLSLVFTSLDFFLGTLRDSYEAYVIYNFFALLTSYLGGEEFLIEWLELRGHIRHPWPFNRFFRPIALGSSFLRRIKQGTLQFVFIKPFTAVLAWGLAIEGLYTEGSYSPYNGFVYVSIINNISVTVSLYCLVLFYVATKTRLEPFAPLPKFMCVKAVVFFSYWQSCVLQGMVLAGWLESYAVSAEIHNVLIAVEMFVAAVAHHVSFPSDEYKDDTASYKPLLPNLIKVLDVHDVIEEGAEAFLKKHRKQEELKTQPV